MATYQFSALADGQAISFNPNNDVLNFDDTQWAAARVRFVPEGANVRVIVEAFSGPTNVVLLNVSPLQFTTGNMTFADGSRLLHGDNSTALNDNAANTLTGTAGGDQLNGFGGVDTMNGGLGNDVYFVTAGDVLSDTGGADTIVTEVSWTLGAGFENVEIAGNSAVTIQGNDLANRIVGNDAANTINARGGSDTIEGRGGNDYFNMSMGSTASFGNDFIVGGEGRDTVDFGGNARSALVADLSQAFVHGGEADGGGASTILEIEDFIAGQFDDHVTGNDAANFLFGWRGNDTLIGAAGNDRLEGADGNDVLRGGAGNDFLISGAGADIHLFAEAPAAGNADTISGFASGTDKIWLDDAWHESIGARGNFAAGDARFWAAAGATSGHDATDRVIYNTSTGNLYYDADGSGAGASVLIATLSGTLAATDIVAMGDGAGVITGTEGDDSLTGTDGNDRMEGLGGNDTLNGMDGNDHLLGGDGNDVLDGGGHDDLIEGGAGDDVLVAGWGLDRLEGGEGNDTLHGGGEGSTMVGGFGDDTYQTHGFFSSDQEDFILIDAGGVDTVVTSHFWQLADGFENLTLFGGIGESNAGHGNSADNVILSATTSFDWITAFGGAGNDTLLGAQGNDYLYGEAGDDWLEMGSDFHEHNLLNGGAGSDRFVLRQTVDPSDALDDQIEDFASGTDRLLFDNDADDFGQLGAAGDFSAGDQRFHASADGVAHDASDRIIYDTDSGVLFYDADGNGAGAAVEIVRLTGAPTVAAADITVIGESSGGGGEEINGTEGNDSIVGTAGDDTINGLGGDDNLLGGDGSDSLNGGDGNDTLNGGFDEDINSYVGDGSPDTLDGGFGDDLYIVYGDGDTVTEDIGGFDEIEVRGASWTLGAGIENLRINNDFSEAPETGIGNELGNEMWLMAGGGRLEGLGGNDTLHSAPSRQSDLFGGDGDDVLSGIATGIRDGGAGNDTLSGGLYLTGGEGADHFDLAGTGFFLDFASAVDRIFVDGGRLAGTGPSGDFATNDGRFYAAAGAVAAHDASDRIIYNTSSGDLFYDPDGTGSAAGFSIATLQDAPSLAATDFYVINGSGGTSGEHIEGSFGDDSLVGTAGDDTMEGFSGDDTMQGLEGDDYIASDEDDDRLEGGAGSDTLDGGSGNDSLSGGDGADSMYGGEGNDTLDSVGEFSHGDGFADTLDGGLGDDVYFVNDDGDVIAADAGGLDTVHVRNGGWTLGAGLENLDLDDTVGGAFTGVGNGLNNVIRGSSEGGELYGMGGNDTLIVRSAFNHSNLYGGDGNDSLVGGDRVDLLDGGAGVDTMSGGLGDDVYVVTSGDVLTEAAGSGVDRVESAVSWALGANFENLTLTGTAAITANGNALDNVLVGNDANNSSINGRAGNDTMFGMGGNDTFDMSTGGTSTYGNDQIDGGAGTDTVDFGSNARTAVNVNLAAGTMSGGGDGGTGSATLTSIENAVGGNFNDVLTGNAAANFFYGAAGNDTLIGAGGNDRLQGAGGNDAFVFNATPGSANSDVVVDFATGVDKLQMENSVMTAIGAAGNFAAGDARFWAAAGATSGHDANDRIVYNLSNGNLYYDADGSGSGTAQLIATLQGQAALAATDIAVI